MRNGNLGARRNVVIHLLAEDRSGPVLTWRLSNAWPVRYRFSNLDAAGKDPLLEFLELTFEHFEME